MGQSDGVRQAVRAVGDCRVCGGREWQDVVSFGPVPLANAFLPRTGDHRDEARYPLGVVSCRICRLMSITHVVDPVLLYRTYSYVTSDSETITEHMRWVARTCRERFGLDAGDLVVEFGSNTGDQLSAMRVPGLRVLGVDPARNLAAVARERGVDTVADFFTAGLAAQIRARYGTADLILGRHVFAHIDDLAEPLTGVRTLLAPAGGLVIEVPYALDLLDKVAFDTIYHEHLSYFLVSTLATLFERHGLRLFDVVRVGVHAGSILVFAGHADGPWRPGPAVSRLIELEASSGAFGDAAYVAFAERTGFVRAELRDLVRGLAAAGASLAGYGASAKGTTMLNVCGIGRGELSYCTDTTALKQDKVLPGTHIPVEAPDYARRFPPDYFLLLAWNYAEEVLRKEAAYLRRGGRFILPLPKPSVVAALPR